MTDNTNMDHMAFLHVVANADIEHLTEKEKTYQGSWKRRGGTGAWMMAVRKIDRLDVMLRDAIYIIDPEKKRMDVQSAWDVFKRIEYNPSGADGTVLAEIRDLRRYLLLIEAEMYATGVLTEGKDVPEPRKEVMLNQPIRTGQEPNNDQPSSDIMSQVGAVAAAPVPLEDSNHHAERTGHPVLPYTVDHHDPRLPNAVYERFGDETYRLRELVAWQSVPQEFSWTYVLIQDDAGRQSALLNRRLVTDHQLTPLTAALNHVEWSQLPWYHRALYEWDSGRTEFRMKSIYEGAWS